jgi:hypothetical protein
MKVKAKIYITQRDNDEYFKQKLSTYRNGFCWIKRTVTLEKDPSGVYFDGEWGYITVGGERVYVCGNGGNKFEIA